MKVTGTKIVIMFGKATGTYDNNRKSNKTTTKKQFNDTR